MKTIIFMLVATQAFAADIFVAVGETSILAKPIEGAASTAGTGAIIFGGTGETPSAEWSGKVVIVDRGVITFFDKAKNIQAAGGVAMVLVDTNGTLKSATLGNGNTSTIPAVFVSVADGAILKAKVGEVARVGPPLPPIAIPDPTGRNGEFLSSDGAKLVYAKPPSGGGASAPELKISRGPVQLTLEDDGDLLAIDGLGAPIDWVIPDDATANFPVGARVFGASVGISPVTVKGMEGVTLISVNNGTRAFNAGTKWEAVKLGSNRWLVDGRLEYIGPPQPVSVGRKVVMTAEYSYARPDPVFQWYKDGEPIAGANGVSLLINEAKETDSGSYTVKVSNSEGEATSAPDVLVVSATAPVFP